MHDIFNEYLIKKLLSFSDYLKKIGIAVLGIIIMALGIVYAGALSVLIIAGVGVGVYFVYKEFDLEFEYILTNNELDVDKVISRERRKHMLTVKVTDFEILAPFRGNYLEPYRNTLERTIDVSSHKKSPNRWFAVWKNEGKLTMLIFEPPQKMRDGIAAFIPRRVKKSEENT